MKVLVLIAGIADPKWPLPSAAEMAALLEHSSRYAVPSPFDEAALELALKLREIRPGATLHALVAGTEALARKIAEWRLDSVQRLAQDAAGWDATRCAAGIAGAARTLKPDLVLVGREFGDFDDGAIPALLARALALPHFPLTTNVALHDGALRGTRQRAGRIERFRLPDCALLSVTNDPQNRLRHPLLKNVMAARRANVPVVSLGESVPTVQLRAMELSRPPVRTRACRMLAGDLAGQCAALADALLQEGASA